MHMIEWRYNNSCKLCNWKKIFTTTILSGNKITTLTRHENLEDLVKKIVFRCTISAHGPQNFFRVTNLISCNRMNIFNNLSYSHVMYTAVDTVFYFIKDAHKSRDPMVYVFSWCCCGYPVVYVLVGVVVVIQWFTSYLVLLWLSCSLSLTWCCCGNPVVYVLPGIIMVIQWCMSYLVLVWLCSVLCLTWCCCGGSYGRGSAETLSHNDVHDLKYDESVIFPSLFYYRIYNFLKFI